MNTSLTVYEAIRDTARYRGGSVAVVFGELELTYADLIRNIDTTAEALRHDGLQDGVVFAAYAGNCPELLYCYFAAAKTGATFVPINPNMTASEVSYVVEHCEAKALYCDVATVNISISVAGSVIRGELSHLLGGPVSRAFSPPSSSRKADDACLIIYTSGSTGTPKAVVLSHAAQVSVCDALIELWSLTDRDVTLVALPLGYLYGISTAAAVGLRAGGKVVVLPKFRPGDVLSGLIAARATVFHGVPTMFSMMLEYTEQNRLNFDLSGVRQMITAGSPLADEVARRFEQTFRKQLSNYYAMTECTPVFGLFAEDTESVPPGAVGRKAPAASIRIVDTKGGDCPPGVDGELWVRAAATMSGYLKDPTLTDSVLADGYFKSGDLGHVDAEGWYYITGRIKDTIIRGGANIAPAEVEGVLSRHAAVQDVAVVGAPDPIFGELPVAFVVLRPKIRAEMEELIAYAKVSLADFKVPGRIILMESLPLGKTGKVDRNALKLLARQQ